MVREFQRNFQCPTGLDDHTQIAFEVRFSGATMVGCSLNGRQLECEQSMDGAETRWRFHVKSELQPTTNHLCVSAAWSELTANSDELMATMPQVVLILGGTGNFGN